MEPAQGAHPTPKQHIADAGLRNSVVPAIPEFPSIKQPEYAPLAPLAPLAPQAPLTPSLSSGIGSIRPGFGTSKAKQVLYSELGESIGVLIDEGVELQVGSVSYLRVRFERKATPARLNLYLHWEIEVDGRMQAHSSGLVIWREHDWDQEASLPVKPSQPGEVRLVRLSVGMVMHNDLSRWVLVTLSEVPLTFKVKEPKAVATVQNVTITASGAGSSIYKPELNLSDVGTRAAAGPEWSPHELSRETETSWWTMTRATTVLGATQRIVLTWMSGGQQKTLIVVHQSNPVELGRNHRDGAFCLRWSRAAFAGADADEHYRDRNSYIGRIHAYLGLFHGDVRVVPFESKLLMRYQQPAVKPGGERTSEEVELKDLLAVPQDGYLIRTGVEFFYGWCDPGRPMDGFRFKVIPLGSHPHSAALITRSTDQANLAYLLMNGPTYLTGASFLRDLPQGLQFEPRGGTIAMTYHPRTDLASLKLTFRDCSEAEFKDGV